MNHDDLIDAEPEALDVQFWRDALAGAFIAMGIMILIAAVLGLLTS